MPRTMLTDALWLKLLQLMQHSGRIYNKPEHRMTFRGSFLECERVVHDETY